MLTDLLVRASLIGKECFVFRFVPFEERNQFDLLIQRRIFNLSFAVCSRCVIFIIGSATLSALFFPRNVLRGAVGLDERRNVFIWLSSPIFGHGQQQSGPHKFLTWIVRRTSGDHRPSAVDGKPVPSIFQLTGCRRCWLHFIDDGLRTVGSRQALAGDSWNGNTLQI